jgi:NADPH:quinone reductase-like Zn-dependent oxidoreductase
MKKYQIVSDEGIDELHFTEGDMPSIGEMDVLVRMKASSINYRDLATIENPMARKINFPLVPNSDGMGEVVEMGKKVTRVSIGDRVCGIFFQTWIDGEITSNDMANALGGTIDGVLCEYRTFHEDGLVKIPSHLTDAEASTLPCAGVTAWNSLVDKGCVKPGSTVLLLGTGGVSIMALQFCQMLGVKAILTSSSDEKLEKAQALGAWQVINYKKEPDWDLLVLDITNGLGVDHVVEVGGAGTLSKSINSVCISGSIGLIGILTGGQIDPTPMLRKSLHVHGIYVGHRRMFEDMNRAISAHEMRPVIEHTYPIDSARDAYHAMRAANHFGKLTITL